jgi:hypothetical protein
MNRMHIVTLTPIIWLGISGAEAVAPSYFWVNHESGRRDTLCEISRVRGLYGQVLPFRDIKDRGKKFIPEIGGE